MKLTQVFINIDASTLKLPSTRRLTTAVVRRLAPAQSRFPAGFALPGCLLLGCDFAGAPPSSMEFSGPERCSSLEDDLALSEDEYSPVTDHWPELPERASLPSLAPPLGKRPFTSSSSTKRPAEDPATEDCLPPAAKTAKGAPAVCGESASALPPRGVSPSVLSRPSPALPPFAPRDEYVKFSFDGNPSPEVKLRWLSAVSKAFHLSRDAAEVKMAALTSRFVYVSRRRSDILERVRSGEFLSLPLVPHDSPERPRKYPHYLLTRYPVDVDHRLAEQYPGVYSSRRLVQNGSPINRIVIVWSLPEQPPPSIAFNFLPLLPPCEVRRLHDDKPWCFRCWGLGHISRYCSASPRCGWCAAGHESKECPLRRVPLPAASTSTSEPPPPPDSSRWKCLRCLQPGVSVWHGCSRRRAPSRDAASVPPPPPPPPPPRPVPTTSSTSPSDAALHKAVTSLQARCAALESRFASLDATIEGLVTAHAATASRVSSLVVSYQTVVDSVSKLAERMDAVASRLDKLCGLLPSPSQSSPGRSSSSTLRSSPSKTRVRH